MGGTLKHGILSSTVNSWHRLSLHLPWLWLHVKCRSSPALEQLNQLRHLLRAACFRVLRVRGLSKAPLIMEVEEPLRCPCLWQRETCPHGTCRSFLFLRWLNRNLRRVKMQRFISGDKLRLCKEWPSGGPALAKDCECPVRVTSPSPDLSGSLGLWAHTTPNNLLPRPSPDSLGKTLQGSELPFSLHQPCISIRMSTGCRSQRQLEHMGEV